MKTLRTKQTVKLVSVITLSLIVFGTSLIAQPTFMSNEDYTENEIQVEEWMTNYETFNPTFNDEMFTEEPLPIQSWMLNADEMITVLDDSFSESPMPIEEWMVNYNKFTGQVEEPMIAVEDWMIDYNVFNEKSFNIEQLVAEQTEELIDIEAWMTNLEAFNEKSSNFIPSIETINFETEPLLMALHDIN
ncbi:hypothetical protein [Carboxylicivirga caseinilyticus]|uniref:hypothetical protein n=1 Tax=Carboxylicivirga caseinilyticus TaxID=3417572 RepID=UPI003D33869A|nr:hypothetical protein [Marinilabiliaceae bacterium A049]